MSEILLNEIDFGSGSQTVTNNVGIDVSTQPGPYGFGSTAKNPGLGIEQRLDYVPNCPTSDSASIPWMASESVVSSAAQANSIQQTNRDLARPHTTPNTDSLTGQADNEPILLDLNGGALSNQTLYGRLDYSDYFNPTRLYAYKDDYLFTATSGTAVQINLNSYDFDAYLQLVDPYTGSVLAFDDDSGEGTNAQLSFTVQAGGQYLIRATSYSSFEVGGYSLTAYLRSGGNPNPPSPPSGFDRSTGYGLVDAAAAVAQAIGQSRFGNVPDIGGNQWNNDMVNAPEVWARGHTGRGVTVAVIDSGVDINHEDLRNNIWVNTDEILGDGIDNDGNGYTDDRFGWNFGRGQNNNDVRPGTSDPGQSHGTHVAGTIAAMNDGRGMTGVAHGANIMAIRMGDVNNNRFTNGGSLAQAIRYAVDNGARVINMSLSWNDEGGAVRDALAYAAARNVITVSSAGNEGDFSPNTAPGQYATDYGLVVGAVDSRGNQASFSDRAGSDSRMQYVTAPGVSIYSTVAAPRRYDYSDGTSMAAPHVAGVVALMLGANPNLTHNQVRSILTSTTAPRSRQSVSDLPATRVEIENLSPDPWDLIGPSSSSPMSSDKPFELGWPVSFDRPNLAVSSRSTQPMETVMAAYSPDVLSAEELPSGFSRLNFGHHLPAVEDAREPLWSSDLIFSLQLELVEKELVGTSKNSEKHCLTMRLRLESGRLKY